MKTLNAFLHKHMGPLARLLDDSAVPKAAAPVKPVPPLIRRRKPRSVMAPVMDDALQITCPDPTAEDVIRDKHIAHAQRLVRQENWDKLIALIETADKSLHLTPGTMPVADLLSYGARADVVLAAEHALMDGAPAEDAALLAGIEALEHVMADHPTSYILACIVAQAHMDIGWAWRGNCWDAEVPKRNRAVFAAHFDRAADIMQAFCCKSTPSPLLAATCCAVLGGTDQAKGQAADRYQILIDMNHANPRPMRAMGNHLLPRWFGSYAELELEARRTASRTQDTWGAGGYTWVQFDAITCDDEACANLDLEFFVEGLRDILARRSDPYTVNLLAAYCANAIGQSFSGNDQADQIRAQIADNAGWIIRNHLTELHPMIWAHAARGFDNNLRIHSPTRFAASGKDDAMRIITSLFSKEIAAGKRIVFTDEGPVTQTA
ncbi:MAG: hypothetical protein AB8B60_17935 [Sulfitobacter sp.]